MIRPTRRLFAGAAVAFFFGLAPAQDAVRSVSILHTNDLHARLLPSERHLGGFAQLATAIRNERRNCHDCILLSAGDLVQGDPVSTIYHGLPVYKIGNRFGFDAATLGNHEFDYGWEYVPRYLRIARYPIVAANLVDGRGRPMTRRPYVILKTNGVRVAVIGALTEDLAVLTIPKTRGTWRALPVVDSVRRYAEEVRPRSDLIVLLAHLTEREEREILGRLPEVAFVITGHGHRGMDTPIRRDGRGLVRARAYGEELGRLNIRVDIAAKKVVSWEWKRIPIDASRLAAAPDVERQVKHWESEVARVVDTPIGESRQQFSKAEVKQLMERAMAEEMKTDFAFMNSGGVRDVLPRGPLLARHVWNIMPFDNMVVVARVKGSDLPPTVHTDGPVDPGRTYTLATSDFTAANQSAPGELGSKGLVFSDDGPPLRDLLIRWIRKQKVLGR